MVNASSTAHHSISKKECKRYGSKIAEGLRTSVLMLRTIHRWDQKIVEHLFDGESLVRRTEYMNTPVVSISTTVCRNCPKITWSAKSPFLHIHALRPSPSREPDILSYTALPRAQSPCGGIPPLSS